MREPSSSSSDGSAPTAHGLSRRALVGWAAGIAALAAVGVPAITALVDGPTGKLVEPLLAARPFYVAHRGGSRNWPEMSMEAYRNSVRKGIDALDVSLARTSDGVWFGLHDMTLDRTSGTRGFVAAEHTWAEVQRHTITAAATDDPRQPRRPYMTFRDLAKAYGTTHTIFVDPKWALSAYYPELLEIMDAAVATPAQTFIAKAYCTGVEWAAAAASRGYTTWGYYYASEISANDVLLPSTQGDWGLLGLDYAAAASAWEAIRRYGKPVIGHVAPTRAAAESAIAKGAVGVVVSGVTQVMG
jgi:hypothetical protein